MTALQKKEIDRAKEQREVERAQALAIVFTKGCSFALIEASGKAADIRTVIDILTGEALPAQERADKLRNEYYDKYNRGRRLRKAWSPKHITS